MSESDSYTIRSMQLDDIPKVLDIRRSHHHQYGIHSLHTLLNMDPNGLFVAVNEKDEICGSCAVVEMSSDSSNLFCVGLHAVKTDLQRKGVGRKLWKAAMDYLGPDKNAYLICGVTHIKLYNEKNKFSSAVDGTLHYSPPGPVDLSKLTKQVEGVSIETYNSGLHLQDVVNYDEGVTGYRREMYIDLTLKEKGNCVKVAIAEGQVVGYGIACQSISGAAMLKTVYADNRDIAECLVFSVLSDFPLAEREGVTSLFFVKKEEDKILEEKLGLFTYPYVKMFFRFKAIPGDVSRQFVVSL